MKWQFASPAIPLAEMHQELQWNWSEQGNTFDIDRLNPGDFSTTKVLNTEKKLRLSSELELYYRQPN